MLVFLYNGFYRASIKSVTQIMTFFAIFKCHIWQTPFFISVTKSMDAPLRIPFFYLNTPIIVTHCGQATIGRDAHARYSFIVAII